MTYKIQKIEILETYVGFIIAGILLFYVPSSLAHVAAFFLIGVMQYRLVMSCHEAVHGTLIDVRSRNDKIGVIHSALVGIDFYRYRSQHLSHHGAATLEHDSDAYIYQPVLQATPGLSRIRVLIFGIFREALEKIRQKGMELPSNRSANRTGLIWIAGAQALLLLSFGLSIGWQFYFLYWIVPLVFIAGFLNRIRVIIEHAYPLAAQAKQNLGELRVDTINIRANLLERHILAPFLFNYHKTHHRYPAIECGRMPALTKTLAANDGQFVLTEKSYVPLLWELCWAKAK